MKEEKELRKFVRSFMAGTFTLLVIYMYVMGKDVPPELLTLYGTLPGFYFGSKKVA